VENLVIAGGTANGTAASAATLAGRRRDAACGPDGDHAAAATAGGL